MTNHGVLNEAFAYPKPSSFSRGMRIDLNGITILLISGTASIDENGTSVHIGDFRAQMRRTFANITGLLAKMCIRDSYVTIGGSECVIAIDVQRLLHFIHARPRPESGSFARDLSASAN